MITKSGTNRLHGTLWEFNRNNDLTQSYDAIAGHSTTPPRLNRNQFGANIGGPVIIPKVYHGKDKTFFFFNWESGYAAQGCQPRPQTDSSLGSAHWRLHRRGQRADKRSDLDTRPILRRAVPRQYHPAEPAELAVADFPAVRAAAQRQRAWGQLLHHAI